MAPLWQPGIQYNYDDVVEYEGVHYKIIQPHRSQSDWTPPITPALWGRMQGGACHEKPHYGEEHAPSTYNPTYIHQPEHQRREEDRSSGNLPASVEPPKQQEQHWYGDEENKKKFEIGGGILAGTAAIGAGILAYNQHNKKEEEQNAHEWASNNWENEAQARTEQFRSGRYPGPVAWVLTTGKKIPHDAIQGGEERGERLYICRAYYEGGLMIGKACHVFKKGAVIGYSHKEIHLEQYEILVGDSRAVKWVHVSGELDIKNLGARPVEGGREPNGEPQYIIQAPYNGAVHPGKACESFGNGCFIPYDGTEKKVKEYAILCYV